VSTLGGGAENFQRASRGMPPSYTLALDLTPAVVVGHSSGAAIACSQVVCWPEVVRHAETYEPPLLERVADDTRLLVVHYHGDRRI
jgi:hypothetical protein